MDMVQVVILAITGNTLLLAVLGWLARSLIQNMFAKDLSTHRIRLEAENERAAIALGHELSLTAKEHDIRFGKLHERRADTIAKLYELLVDTSEKGSTYSSPIGFGNDPPKSEQYGTFAESYNSAATFFFRNKIFLPALTCTKIEELFRAIKEHPSRMQLYMNMAERHPESEMSVKSNEAWDQAWKYFDKEFKPAMAALENDLRMLLGDNA